ncbi:MAG: molecular chaperone HtpG [Gammaproteobacteria bacterium]
MSTATNNKQTLSFQAEVTQLLHLMINSLYSNKEIFLRELISNASDAADKLRFEALANPTVYENDSDLKVWVELNKDARTITIRDNGIGMNMDEVIKNLGTIAKSGTKEFLSKLTGDRAKDSQLIGQFGVGFYSAFIVADEVEVTSRHANDNVENGVRWKSTGNGEYEIENISKTTRGTEVVLHLKPNEEQFLNSWHVRHVITKYSDHISLPIVMAKENNTEETDKEKDSTIIEVPEEEVINRAIAVWALPKQNIKDDQYIELYKHIAHDFEEPLTWTHNKVEGKLEYITLLYIPKRAPFDLYHVAKPKGLKLYVKRVFIMDDAEQFLPLYLRFVRGIVDSNDLPLNVSREILQHSDVTASIRSGVVKRVLEMLESMAEKDSTKYLVFWKEFGQVLKEGPAEDFSNREKIAKLLRFSSTYLDNTQQDVSLDNYIERLKPEQENIYYVTADSFNTVKASPHLEIFRKKDIEVLLLSDRIDEWMMSHLTEYNGKKFKSIAKGDLELGKLEDEQSQKNQQQLSEEFKDLIADLKKELGEHVKDVRITVRLTDSPACIVTDQNDVTPQMERILRAAGQVVPKTKPILEINPKHTTITNLCNLKSKNPKKFTDLCFVLLDQAILIEGGQLEDPAMFAKRFNNLMLDLVF